MTAYILNLLARGGCNLNVVVNSWISFQSVIILRGWIRDTWKGTTATDEGAASERGTEQIKNERE